MTNETPPSTKHSLIRIEQVKERTGLSRSSIYAFMSEMRFPKPVHISFRSVAWVEHEIDEWIAARIQQRHK